MTQNNYFLDATVLIDYFSEKDIEELGKVRNFVENIVSDEEIEIHTNTVVLLEFAKFLFYQKISPKKIRTKIRQMMVSYNIVSEDYSKTHFRESLSQLTNIDNNSECHAGELSLLSLFNEFDSVFASSDESALSAFTHVKRVNPRKSDYVYSINQKYPDVAV